MSFTYPWLLILVPLLLWLLQRRRTRTSIMVASERLWPTQTSEKIRYLWLPKALRNSTIMLLLVALARPMVESSYEAEVSEGIAIQLLVDVSSSMDMSIKNTDGKSTTRMELAKGMVARFIAGDEDQLNGRPNDLIGLITFARYADTRSPLTFGHEALLQIVNHLTIQERQNEDGTAYGDALAIAAARLNNLEELQHSKASIDAESIQSKVIILLTDGENNSGAHLPVEAAGLAKAWGCKIYVISLGDAPQIGGLQATLEPQTPAEQILEHIATQTGGIFRKASDFESLVAVYSEIDRLERSKLSTRSFDRMSEWFWLPLAAGLVCLLLALILEATWFRIAP
jgi:Ca-activated chloride channel family protein